MQSYDWSQFHVRMYYLAPLTDVFRRFATAEGLESFFIHKAVHTAADGTPRGPAEQVQSGDGYHWTYVHDFAHGGGFLEVVPGRSIRFTFGTMTVDVGFRDLGEATEVDLHQTNCATVDPDRAWQHLNCRSCWIYFLTNLRSVLAGGPDLRDHRHPNWNDSVSIGFDPESGPGQPR
jgi:uncharacterized protein YndB with AHSA1/START domain